MENTIRSIGSPLSVTDITVFEKTFQTEIPPVYKTFLLEHNGCTFEYDCFDRKLDSGYQQELSVEELFPLQEIAIRWYYVKKETDSFGVMLIGATPAQPFLCVGLQADNRDIIYVFDGDFGWSYLAKDIHDFIANKLYS